MKRAYSPKEIAAKKWVTLPWNEKWSKPFGFPAENASWFISGASASGKSSFVMQLGKELCNYGTVLYMSYEEKINQSFQRRMEYCRFGLQIRNICQWQTNPLSGAFERPRRDSVWKQTCCYTAKEAKAKCIKTDSPMESVLQLCLLHTLLCWLRFCSVENMKTRSKSFRLRLQSLAWTSSIALY